MDNNNPQTWREVKPNDVVLISDQQSLQDSSKAGLGLKPLQYTVTEIITVQEMDDLATWMFFHLKPTQAQIQQELVLLCKMVDTEMDLRIYYQTEFTPGSRSDIIKRGDLFLFQSPADPDNFKASELKFTADLTHEGNRWELKGFGEMNGEVSFKPYKSGMDEMVGTIAEYSLTQGESLDAEILILEIGKGVEGLVKMLAGCGINQSEIEVFPV